MAGRNVQLPVTQWRWLQQQSEQNFSRSVSAELRRIVAAAMKAHEEALAAA
jgi:hypothetical protein